MLGRKPAVSTPRKQQQKQKVRGWEAMESSGLGDELCFYWTNSGGHGPGNELSACRAIAASSTLTAVPQGWMSYSCVGFLWVYLVFTGHSGIAE